MNSKNTNLNEEMTMMVYSLSSHHLHSTCMFHSFHQCTGHMWVFIISQRSKAMES